MSRAAQKLISASGGKAYEIDQSLMFDRGNGAYLLRDDALITDGNKRTFTFATWFKKVQVGTNDILFNVRNGGGNELFMIYIPGSEQTMWIFQKRASDSAVIWYLEPTQKLRDVGAWYHFVIAVDTTQSTASDRVKLYINGTQVTSFTGSSSYPDQNLDTPCNNDSFDHQIGYSGSASLDGYMAETYLIDGTAQAASAFGETDAVTGAWIPKKYTGSFGNNGFYMPWKKNDRYSVYFDGSTSTGLQTADSSDFTLGTNNFTIEAWVYSYEDQGETRYIVGQTDSGGADANSSFTLFIDANNKPRAYFFYSGGNLDLISSTAIAENTWNHMAFVRNGTGFVLYLNGTSVATATSSESATDSGYKVGVGVLGEYVTAGQFYGWISNFRIVNGSAVYTSNFTPSTSPLTAVTNTKLLCCQDSTITTDNSGTSKTITVVNTANTYSQQMAPFNFDWWQDQSGQDNDYQPYNINVNNVMLDSPTNNFPTFNFLMGNGASGITLSQGALKAAQASLTSDTAKSYSTIGLISGKWYVEVACSAANVYSGNGVVNVSQSSEGFDFSSSTNNVSVFSWGDRVYKNGSQTQSGVANAASSTNILGIALDLDNGTVQLYSNGSTTGSAETLTRNTGDVFVFCNAAESGGYASTSAYEWNFGQNGTHCETKVAGGNTDGNGIGNYMYSVPSGFLAPCSANLATPAVKKSTANFNIATYTGNSGTQAITGLGMQPDLVWIKDRTSATNHGLHDTVRSLAWLGSNSNSAESSGSSYVSAVGTDGFTVNANSAGNYSGNSYVGWCWKAGGSSSTNNDGAEASTVSVNTTAGFSIIKGEGTGSATTYGHGLGVVPKVYIVKLISDTGDWYLQTSALDGGWDYFQLNGTAAPASMSATAPTSSVIYSNATDGEDFIIYAWAEVEGFSRFGNYIGNGNTDGVFVNCGFRPAYVLFKNHGSSAWWWVHDTGRDPLNLNTLILFPNATTADYTSGSNGVDFLSNGIKLRADNDLNGSGQNVFFMAFAEFPFKYANSR